MNVAKITYTKKLYCMNCLEDTDFKIIYGIEYEKTFWNAWALLQGNRVQCPICGSLKTRWSLW